jgi:hypothetical protein
MRTLNELYEGRVLAVNLIDMKGDQWKLGDAYRAAVTRSAATGADVEYARVHGFAGVMCCTW